MKPIVLSHQNPALADYKLLEAAKPEQYGGFVYLWKCIPEDMFYIGSHKGTTTDLYRGSGKRFRQVFEYYGVTQFDRVILEYVPDADDLRSREQYWIQKFNAVTSSRFLNEKNALNR